MRRKIIRKNPCDVPSKDDRIKHDGPACSNNKANGEEHDHGASEFVSDGVPPRRDPGKQEDDGDDVEGFVQGSVYGDAGYGGVGEDVDPEAHAGDEHEYFELERGEEGH